MNNKCQIASHNQKKILTVCLSTECKQTRVSCQMCVVEFHKDHIEQLVDLDHLMEFIKTEGQKPAVVSPNVEQMLQRLTNAQKNVEVLLKLITQEMKRLYSINLQQYCRDIGNRYNIQTEQLGNQKWSELAEDMLSQVEIKNGELREKSSDVNLLGQPHQLFKEHFSEQIAKTANEFHAIQQVIDPKSFQQLTVPYILEGHDDEVTGIDICEARNLLVSASSDGTVKLWNLSDFKQLKTYEDTDCVLDVVFSSNGNLIAYGGQSKIITLIDINDLSKQDIVWILEGHSYSIIRLIFSSDSMHLISGSDDHTLRIWSVKTKVESFKLNAKSGVRGVEISNDNSLIASNEENGVIQIWKFKDQTLLVIKEHAHTCGRGIQFSNDQKMLVSCGDDGVVNMWSLTELDQGKLSLIKKIEASNNEIFSVSLTSDSKFIICHCNVQQKVKVMDSSTGELIKLYDVKEWISYGDVAITRNADMIAYSNGQTIVVWKRN